MTASPTLWPWQLLYSARFIARPLRPDVVKSWDVVTAAALIRDVVPDRAVAILDMGCFASGIVPALYAAGYRNLHGIDLNPRCRWMPYWHRVRYVTGDLTRTEYAGGSFHAITCMSVVEHGVDIQALALEVRRLLTPGGLFILTTDFDALEEDHPRTARSAPFGLSWRIFNRTSLAELITTFAAAGLTLFGGANGGDLDHDERPIRWNGEAYTFVFLAFRSVAEGLR